MRHAPASLRRPGGDGAGQVAVIVGRHVVRGMVIAAGGAVFAMLGLSWYSLKSGGADRTDERAGPNEDGPHAREVDHLTGREGRVNAAMRPAVAPCSPRCGAVAVQSTPESQRSRAVPQRFNPHGEAPI